MVSSGHDALMTTAGPCVGRCAAPFTSDSEKKSINATWPIAFGAPVVQSSSYSLPLFESAQEGQAAPQCNTPGAASPGPLPSGGRAALASLDKNVDCSFGDREVSAASHDHLGSAPRPSQGFGPSQAQARTDSGTGPGPSPCTGQVQAQPPAAARPHGYQCHGSAELSRCDEAVDFADDVLRYFSVDDTQPGGQGAAPPGASTTSQQVVGDAAIVSRRPSAAGAAASSSLDQTRPGGLALDQTRPGGLPVGLQSANIDATRPPALSSSLDQTRPGGLPLDQTRPGGLPVELASGNMDATRPSAGFTPAPPLGTLDITRPGGTPQQAPSPKKRSVARQAPQPPPQTRQAFEDGHLHGHLPPPPPPVEVLFPGRGNSRDF